MGGGRDNSHEEDFDMLPIIPSKSVKGSEEYVALL